jgi:ribonuclease R
MNTLARRLQKRRYQQGQINLDLPAIELKLDEEGKVVGAEPEDTSFTHTLIEMFMVEANEAVARLLDALHVPFLRRVHPDPEPQGSERLRHFVQAAGYKIPKDLDRKAIQSLLAAVRGKPESYPVNLAVLRSLSRAEYSPENVGHFALASKHYCHFTSPIRRYADLTIHRLLDAYFVARTRAGEGAGEARQGRRKLRLEDIPSYEDLVQTGEHISFTERRAQDAERELRQVKVLELLKGHIGDEFDGVVTGITNFGVFIQLTSYLIDGLIRYEDLGDDWWQVDEKAGRVVGQRTGTRIKIGDPARVRIVGVDQARRELNLAIQELPGRRGGGGGDGGGKAQKAGRNGKAHKSANRGGNGGGSATGGRRKPKADRAANQHGGGSTRRNQRSKQRSRKAAGSGGTGGSRRRSAP